MLNIIIFGAPGSGKGTQSELMIVKYGLDYISTGAALRDAILEGSKLGNIAKSYIDRGKLVPDELTIQLISDFLDKNRNSKGIIFDGFPRTIPQAIALKGILDVRGMDISVLLDLQVDDNELIQRLLERGKRIDRSDDNPETIQSRLNVYHTQTAPLATYYISEGKYAPIKGIGTVEEIFRRIDDAITSRKEFLSSNL
ncbi:MAG: adenylate kinase [Tannerella sp.]|jgi:adenylate kinase|nr:adenylate kinase [Tannerella sp.]